MIIDKFRSHPSIIKLKQNIFIKRKFTFKSVTKEYVKNILNDLCRIKAAGDDVGESTFIPPYLVFCVNEAVVKSELFHLLKLLNIGSVHKREDPTDKMNYMPVTILPLLSKVFEKVMYEQLYEYLNSYLNDLLFGFRKAY